MSISAAARRELVNFKRISSIATCEAKNLQLSVCINDLPAISLPKLQSADLSTGDVISTRKGDYMLSSGPETSLTGMGSISSWSSIFISGYAKHFRQGVQIATSVPIAFYESRFYAASSSDFQQGDVFSIRDNSYRVDGTGFVNQGIVQLVTMLQTNNP